MASAPRRTRVRARLSTSRVTEIWGMSSLELPVDFGTDTERGRGIWLRVPEPFFLLLLALLDFILINFFFHYFLIIFYLGFP